MFFQLNYTENYTMNNRKTGTQKKAMLPITINGSKAAIDASTIPANKWYHCHGQTKAGVQVNSLQASFVGDSVIVKRHDGFETSFDANEFEILAAKYNEARDAANKALLA
ncbi:MAG: hypothetical protein HZB11_01575 [Candidatus Yonathbacteria bacterium]|nr:hypothetical protein [Candidatus Yonathbacteria bacterium]